METGQQADTPPVDDQPGASTESVASPGSMTDEIVAAAAAADKEAAAEEEAGKETPADETGAEAETKTEKAPPYDQDPKWKAARAAEASLNDILESHGFESADELKSELAKGRTLIEVLGDRDAKQVVEDSDTLNRYQDHWDAEKQKQELDELDPEEQAEYWKNKFLTKEQKDQETEASKQEAETVKGHLSRYSDFTDSIIESAGFDDQTAEAFKLFAGVNNPFNTVDIGDRKAVRQVLNDLKGQFSKFVETTRQGAVDEYATGKSKLTPSSKKEKQTDTGPSDEEKEVETKTKEDATPEEAFMSLADNFKEMIDAGRFGS